MAGTPVGVAGWIVEKLGKRAGRGPDVWSGFSEEHLLANIVRDVAPSLVVAATWISHGRRLEGARFFPFGTRIHVPAGVAAFPVPCSRRCARSPGRPATSCTGP